ncbi:hypothetical protein [Streptomyces fumanus]|uniref:Uncharacterized protein n=1 Tax=Streptomyces fumanus TaxID=67302 RepID=A0A919AC10_9ACTN|nr:hypothetical protein [Streptomyces fumanus]GHE98440.1 hypothetical protein GCM10018772_23590 [Streptomyces fumanus]
MEPVSTICLPAPELPLRTESLNAPPRLRRLGTRLTTPQWTALNRQAARAGATASGVLVQAFAQSVGPWSRRPPFHRDVREGPIPDDVVEDMFGAFAALVTELADGDGVRQGMDPVELPAHQRERLARVNATEDPRSADPCTPRSWPRQSVPPGTKPSSPPDARSTTPNWPPGRVPSYRR